MLRGYRNGSPFALTRVLECAVGHALFSSLAACGGQSSGTDVAPLSPAFSFPEATPTEAGGAGFGPAAVEPAAVEPNPVSPDLHGEACPPPGGSRFSHMELSEAYDFLALRVSDMNSFDPLGEVLPGQEVDVVGRACEGAAEATLCRAELSRAWPGPESGWIECGQAGCYAHAVVSTNKDDVTVRQTLPEIGVLLGDIDTPVEALFWAEANGYTPRCESDTLFGVAPLELTEVAAGYRLRNYEMVDICPIRFEGVVLDIARDGRLNEVERFPPPPNQVSGCVGRRPPGLAESRANREGAALGEFFGRVATLEAAAVTAFHVIEAELEAFGAPSELRAAAREAGADEVRHARFNAELARAWGKTPEPPQIAARPPRSLFDFARDNVIEGCVREAFGAAVAKHQATSASHPRVRECMASIALDECRHAELSFRIAAWLESQLGSAELAALRVAAREAIAELRSEVCVAPSTSVQLIAGMPNAPSASRMLDVLDAQVWKNRAAWALA